MESGKIEPAIDCFMGTAEPRNGVNRLYPLEEVIAITILAVMSFARDWEDIERYGAVRKERLSKHLKLENGIPRHDVFRRVFCALKSEAVEECFMNWVRAVKGRDHGDTGSAGKDSAGRVYSNDRRAGLG